MAKSKARSGTKKNGTKAPKPKAPGGAKSAALSAASLGDDAITAEQLVALVPALDDAARTAFEAAFTAAQCLDQGAATRSERVLRNGTKWAAVALPWLRGSAAADVSYGLVRLSWLVELLVRLGHERGIAAASDDDGAGITSERDGAVARARQARKGLLNVLGRITSGRDKDAGMVAAAGKDARSLDALRGSLKDLITVGTRLLADPSAAPLVAGGNLTQARLNAAKAALAALTSSDDKKQLGGSATGGKDSPAVNLIEGRVLLEMIHLRDAFDEAREDGIPVPVLVPDSGLAHALARTHATRKASADPAPTTTKTP